MALKRYCKHGRVSISNLPVRLKQSGTTAQVTSPGGLLDIFYHWEESNTVFQQNLSKWQMVEKGSFESFCILCQSEDNKSFWLLDLGNKYEPSGFRGKIRNRGHHSLVKGSGRRSLLTFLWHISGNNKCQRGNPDALGLTLFPEREFEEATKA